MQSTGGIFLWSTFVSLWVSLTLTATIAIAVLGYAAYRWFEADFLKGLELDNLLDGLEMTWTPEEFPNTGTLPMSTKVSGTFVRWHNPQYYRTGEEFWETFQDGPWKWADQQRYAGKDLNCGHYFALTQAGAKAEGSFYGLDFTQYRLLSVDLECDAILDLTYENNLLQVAKQAFANWQEISERHFLVTILSWLTDSSRGGVPFTDYIGHWASRNGYDGILFFGARALEANPSLKWYIDNGSDDGMAGPIVHGYFFDMRKTSDLKNLVVFSGSRLASRIVSSQLLPDLPDPNPYHGKSESEINVRLQFKADYQAEQAAKGFYLEKPFTIQ